jgi:hypothetical protein
VRILLFVGWAVLAATGALSLSGLAKAEKTVDRAM